MTTKMQLGEYLNAINTNKNNIIRESDAPKQAERAYPAYITAKLLSYHKDCILLVNELNVRYGLSEHHLTGKMHFEFLVHVLDRRKRFSKLGKPERQKQLEAIQKHHQCSLKKARQVFDLFDENELDNLVNLYFNSPEQE